MSGSCHFQDMTQLLAGVNKMASVLPIISLLTDMHIINVKVSFYVETKST